MTGVVVGVSTSITVAQAMQIRDHLCATFPGITFAVIGDCSALATFAVPDVEAQS